MASNARTPSEIDTEPAFLEGYTEPVVVVVGSNSQPCLHKPNRDSSKPEPACLLASRGGKWRLVERGSRPGKLCKYCYGEREQENPGDKECPFCGESVHATLLGRHIRTECSK